MCFPSRRDGLHIPIIIFHLHFTRHKFCDFDQLLSLSHHGKLCATTDLLSSSISGDKINQPLAVDLRNYDVLGHYSTLVPFLKQSSANCSRWNIIASSLIKSCCYIFQSLSSVCFYATKKNHEESFFVFPHFVASFQCFLFLSSASKISGLFYCWCLSYSVFYSSKNLHLTNLQLFLSARGLVPYHAVPLLLSRRYFVYLRGIIKLCTTAGRL